MMTRNRFLNTTVHGRAFKQARGVIACVDDSHIRRDLLDALDLRIDYEVKNWGRDKGRAT